MSACIMQHPGSSFSPLSKGSGSADGSSLDEPTRDRSEQDSHQIGHLIWSIQSSGADGHETLRSIAFGIFSVAKILENGNVRSSSIFITEFTPFPKMYDQSLPSIKAQPALFPLQRSPLSQSGEGTYQHRRPAGHASPSVQPPADDAALALN